MLEVAAIATVPACIAIVTVVKDLGLSTKLAPVASIVAGILLSFLWVWAEGGVWIWAEGGASAVGSTVAYGLLLGLSASGLYDGAKVVGTKPRRAADDSEESSLSAE